MLLIKPKHRALAVFILLMLSSAPAAFAQKNVIIGYVGGYKGLRDIDMISPKKLTHINYAFIDVRNNRAWLHNEKTDTVNLRRLVELKKINPELKILISIGGWTWSGKFSDAVLTDTARARFAASAVALVERFNLDGVDIDWEYPARAGLEGNVVRPEDKHNFTLMFKDLRDQLDELQKSTGKRYLLTSAIGAFANFPTHTEMDAVAKLLDYVNLMTYDYKAGNLAAHHTNLYDSKLYPTINSADKAIEAFAAAGVPYNKMVIGIAFYGRFQNLAEPSKRGIGNKIATYSPGRGFTFLNDSLIGKKGYKYYRDRTAKAPYLYNDSLKQFVTFDDRWSVRKKCRYVKSHKMAGVMFWEYRDDPKEYLLDEINSDLR